MKKYSHVNIGAYRYCKPADIVMLKGNVNYTDIYFLNGQTLTVATTLKVLEKRFKTDPEYCRTHKSFLINTQYLKKLNLSNRSPIAEMENGLTASISRRKMSSLKRSLASNQN